MATIVEQLQKDALDPAVSVSTLLRRVKVIAAKLKLPKVEVWVDSELNGYDGEDEVPDYRTMHGLPKAFNPFRGWIPIQMEGDPEMAEVLATRKLHQKVSELEHLVSKEGRLMLPFSAHHVDMLNRASNFSAPQMGLQISHASVVGIIDAVRNRVLDWALQLERNGIIGTDVGFSSDEETKAKQPQVQLHIGSIGNFVGNLGVANTTGDVTVSAIGSDKVNHLVSQIRSHEDELIRSRSPAAHASSTRAGCMNSRRHPEISRRRYSLV
jgi:hypothetical protein